jgi:tetratricopeptide (TPR) repeat protein
MAVPVVQSTAPSPTRQLNAALARLARDPRDMIALLDAGGAALDLGDTDAAIGFLTRAEQVSPGNAGVRARIAIAMLRSSQPFEAIRWFDLADQAGFNRAEMATERGLAYDLIGDNAAAQRQYQLAIAGGQNDEASRRYALSLVIAGDRRGAELVIQPLLERRDRGAWRVRTFIMAIAGQSEEAEGIARATMPADLAAAISPYLRYMPRLTPAQQAAAANLGRFPRAADIGRDDPQIVQYALAHPRAPRVDAGLVPQGEALGARGRDDRDSRGKRRRPGKEERRQTTLAATTPAGQPAVVSPPANAAGLTQSSPAATPPAVTAPWGLQPGARMASAGQTLVQAGAQASVQPPAAAPAQPPKPVVLSRLDVPPGTPLAPPPMPRAAAAPLPFTPPSTPPSAPPSAQLAAVPAPAVSTLGLETPPASATPTPSPQPAPPPPVIATPASAPVQFASNASDVPAPVAPAPVVEQPAPAGSTASGPIVAATAVAATPTDFRSMFDGFKPPEQEAAATTEAVDLARIETLREAVRARERAAKDQAAKDRSAKDAAGKGRAGKDRGERPDGPVAVSRSSDEDVPEPAVTRAEKDKLAKDAAAKSARSKLALAADCADGSGKAKSGKTKAAPIKGRGKATAKGKASAAEAQCPPDGAKAKGRNGKAEPAHASRIWVQVLTGSNRDAMGKEWQRLVREASALRGRKPYLTPWRNNYRLLTGPFASEGEAQGFLGQLRKDGVSAFQWTSPAGQAVDGLSVK